MSAAPRWSPVSLASGGERPVRHATARSSPGSPGHRRASRRCGAAPARSSRPPAPAGGPPPVSPGPARDIARSPLAPRTTDTARRAASTRAQALLVACHPPPETTVSPPPAIHPRGARRPRSPGPPQSPPRTAADPHAAPPLVDPANAKYLARPDPSAASECPSQPSVQVLRRLFDSAQYVSIKYTERLAKAGVEPSVGSVGDSYDNALAETINGLYKAEVIHRRGPWRSFEAVEFATLEWVDWFNKRRLFEPIGNIPPAEAEAAYYAQLAMTPIAA